MSEPRPIDHISYPAACAEAVLIRDYWTARGYWPPEVEIIEIMPARRPYDQGTAVYGVRTDLINGLPRRGRKIDALPARYRIDAKC